MGTSVSRTSNVTDLYKMGLAYDIPSEAVNGMEVEAVHEALLKAAAHIRAGNGPYFLEIKTYRYRGHSVSDPAKYRTKDELERYKQMDPIKVLESHILDNGLIKQKELDKIEAAIKVEIDEAVEFAENSPFPDPSELYTDNYTQEDYPFLT
jgi:pyruvate dehydrogenase E1 component alpha subunit